MSPSRSSSLRGRCSDCHRAAILSGWGHRRRSGLSTGPSSSRGSNRCWDRGRHADVVVKFEVVIAIGAIACLLLRPSELSSSRRCPHVAVVRVVAVGVRVVVRLSLAVSELWSSRHRRGHRKNYLFKSNASQRTWPSQHVEPLGIVEAHWRLAPGGS
jgi:hypothetical protein